MGIELRVLILEDVPADAEGDSAVPHSCDVQNVVHGNGARGKGFEDDVFQHLVEQDYGEGDHCQHKDHLCVSLGFRFLLAAYAELRERQGFEHASLICFAQPMHLPYVPSSMALSASSIL